MQVLQEYRLTIGSMRLILSLVFFKRSESMHGKLWAMQLYLRLFGPNMAPNGIRVSFFGDSCGMLDRIG